MEISNQLRWACGCVVHLEYRPLETQESLAEKKEFVAETMCPQCLLARLMAKKEKGNDYY